jgi:hypothetical protein
MASIIHFYVVLPFTVLANLVFVNNTTLNATANFT